VSERPDTELWAAEILRSSMVGKPDEFTVVRRPDLEERQSRAVDFEIQVGDRNVALEVVQCAIHLGALRVGSQLLYKVKRRFEEVTIGEGLGWMLLGATFERIPGKKSMDAAVEELAMLAVDAARLGLHEGRRTKLDKVDGSLFHEAELVRLAPAPDQMSYQYGFGAIAGPTLDVAHQFVGDLIAKKSTQAVGYREVWLLIIDAELVVDAEDIEQALTSARDRLPANWRRFFWIPATDRSIVQEIPVPRDRHP
jgi:hypothetical protein